MTIQKVGILSPGDMGQAITLVLSQNGLHTLAALDDRSERTRQLATEAKIEDVGSLKNLVIEADLILSVLVPSAATEAAEQIAPIIRADKVGALRRIINLFFLSEIVAA
ncbi:MAG: NAD(P)-binding domain-containing protein [Pseudanabaena sp.]